MKGSQESWARITPQLGRGMVRCIAPKSMGKGISFSSLIRKIRHNRHDKYQIQIIHTKTMCETRLPPACEGVKADTWSSIDKSKYRPFAIHQARNAQVKENGMTKPITLVVIHYLRHNLYYS